MLVGDNTQQGKKSNKMLTDYYLSTGDTVKALTKLNSLPIDDAEALAYYDLRTVLINLKSQDKTLWEMSDAQEQTIRDLAATDDNDSQTKLNAQIILNLVFGDSIVINENYIDDFTALNKSLIKINSNIDENAEFDFELKLMPNPSNAETVISYKLPENSENASIIVYNYLGVKQLEFNLNKEETSVIITKDKLNTGVYTVSLIVNNNLLTNEKLIILNK